MQRFYCPPQNITNEEIIIVDPQEVRHMKNSLRLRQGDKVNIFDGMGSEYHGRIKEISSKVVINDLVVIMPSSGRDVQKITIACAIPKNSRMDDIIDKLTQLRVDRVIPLITERVIVKLNKRKLAIRLARWKKIAISAAKQSQQSAVPSIDNIADIKSLLALSSNYQLKLIPTLEGERKELNQIFRESNYKSILILIGPEGDFTKEEVSLCRDYGFIPVSLGESVLRVETAAVAILSFIRLSSI